jgi:putative acyl-CoA dehydrogenase
MTGSAFATHEVVNQPPPLEDYDLFDSDAALVEAVAREGGAGRTERLAALGRWLGSAEVLALGEQANRCPPELRTHDRFGHRLDRIDFHPAWHALMARAVAERLHALPWAEPGPGAHVVRVAGAYLFNQVDAGVCCPMAMTFAAVPALQDQPELAARWTPAILSASYDPAFRPVGQKAGALIGMAMTEKQGGSDVRANSTRAVAQSDGTYALIGHKWFCSAPMSDAFLTLAQAEAGLTCFLVPRWRPDGTRNAILLQRLKDKLGNRSNASAEIEYAGAFAELLGEPGQGVRTIIKMVHHTRLDAAASAAALIRQAVAQALHHATHRRAFQKALIDQPLMHNVLADLVLESEGAMLLVLRLARAFDGAGQDPQETAFARLATAVAKYWIGKRCPVAVVEALECLGGNGYVETSILPRLYREAPVNSVWEGSGNVICLDVLRALARSPETGAALLAEVELARGADRYLDCWLERLKQALADSTIMEYGARQLIEIMALALVGSLMVRHAPAALADAYCAARLGPDGGRQLGTLPQGADSVAICRRARPQLG